jgi:23S rRNA pseudouridine1911/1915/1917 synthase
MAKKTYIALVHGWVKQDSGTIRTAISRDQIRRRRMTTRGRSGREAITHYRVSRRIHGPYGKFTLLEVKIDTGRTHQIRVHLSSIRHPVVGDKLYGAPSEIKRSKAQAGVAGAISLTRNFLHSAALELAHPRTGLPLSFSRPIPSELAEFLQQVERG